MPDLKLSVIVPCAQQGRWSGFWSCLANLEMPPGVKPQVIPGCSVAANRNLGVRNSLKAGADLLFFLDDDTVFAPSVLTCLLKRMLNDDRLDSVVALCLRRKVPFEPLVYDSFTENGWMVNHPLKPGDRGIRQIAASGSGGLLVRRRVFEGMTDPWWTLGQVEGQQDGWGDDVHFCQKMQQAGFNLFVDFDVPFGHIHDVVLWPIRMPDGSWRTQLATDVPFAQLEPAGHPVWEQYLGTPDHVQEAKAWELGGPKKGRLKSWNK